MHTVESRMRNNNMILRQERAQSRVMRWLALSVFSFVLFIIGMGVWGAAAFVLLGAISITGLFTGAFGVVVDGWIALQPIEPDETTHRTYSEEKPAGLRIVQIDGPTLKLTNLGLSDAEAEMVAYRLDRANWHWSKRVLKGRPDEPNVTNLDALYGDMLAEMRRVGALETVGNQSYVAPSARAAFIAASPTLTRKYANK
jgi:hypothetical protein